MNLSKVRMNNMMVLFNRKCIMIASTVCNLLLLCLPEDDGHNICNIASLKRSSTNQSSYIQQSSQLLQSLISHDLDGIIHPPLWRYDGHTRLNIYYPRIIDRWCSPRLLFLWYRSWCRWWSTLLPLSRQVIRKWKYASLRTTWYDFEIRNWSSIFIFSHQYLLFHIETYWNHVHPYSWLSASRRSSWLHTVRKPHR